jgi:hypothetical protein
VRYHCPKARRQGNQISVVWTTVKTSTSLRDNKGSVKNHFESVGLEHREGGGIILDYIFGKQVARIENLLNCLRIQSNNGFL